MLYFRKYLFKIQHLIEPFHLQKMCEIEVLERLGSAATTQNHVTPGRKDITSSLHQYAVLFSWTSKTPLSLLLFLSLFLFLFFITSDGKNVSSSNAQQDDVAQFPKKFESRQRTWTYDLCTGEQPPPAALQNTTNIVKGKGDDDDEAVCVQRGEKQEKSMEEKLGGRSLGLKIQLYSTTAGISF